MDEDVKSLYANTQNILINICFELCFKLVVRLLEWKLMGMQFEDNVD